MTKMDSILENYMVLNSLFFLIERSIFQVLIKKQGIPLLEIDSEHYLKEIVRHLIFSNVIIRKENKYYFSDYILSILE
jgi:hypothetical protein